MYGMTASVPLRGIVDDFLKKYIDLLYRPRGSENDGRRATTCRVAPTVESQ